MNTTNKMRVWSALTILSFIAQPILPGFAYNVAFADEGENEAVVEAPQEAPVTEEVSEPEAIVVPEESRAPAEPVAEEETPVPQEEPIAETIPQDTEDGVWNITSNGAAITKELVSVHATYTAPQNSAVKVKFTKLPDTPGTLTIKEVKLTEDEQKQLGAVSDTAYDITSTMENGSFRYELTLPKPNNTKDVIVKYAETRGELSSAQDVTQKTTQEESTVTIAGLDHFTIFTVSADTTGGSYTAITNPTIIESAVGQLTDSSTVTINAPTGFEFNTTASSVTATVTSGACSTPPSSNKVVKLGVSGGGSSTETITPSTSVIIVNVRKSSAGVSGCASTITVSGITIRPLAGTPLASAAAVTATSLPLGVTFNATDSYQEIAGAVSNTVSTLGASPTSVLADGTTTSTVTATLVDQFGNPVSGESVSLTKTSGAGTPIISTSPQITDASGIATFTVKSTTVASNVFTATNGGTYSKTATVTFMALPDTTAPTVPVASIPGGEYLVDQSVTLTSTDANAYSIYYTIDGTDPTSASTLYAGPVTINHSLTLKAIAIDGAVNASGIMTETYAIAPVVSEQTILSASTNNPSQERRITWTTDDLSTSRVVFGTASVPVLGSAPNYGYQQSTGVFDLAPNKVTSHSVLVEGLNSNTTYFYRVISAGSPESVSQEYSFGTEPTVGGAGTGGSSGDEPSSAAASSTSTGRTLGTKTTAKKSSVSTTATPVITGTHIALTGTSSNSVAQQYGIAPGQQTSEVPSVSPSPTPTASPKVAGEQDRVSPTPEPQEVKSPNALQNNWMYLILALVIAGLGYAIYRSRRSGV